MTRVLRVEPKRSEKGCWLRRPEEATCCFRILCLIWQVQTQSTVTDASESGTGTIRPILNISTVAARQPAYYMWNMVVPMIAINAISLGSFSIPRQDRISWM